MRFNTPVLLFLSTAGSAAAAPAPISSESSLLSPRSPSYTGAEIVARLATVSSPATPGLQSRQDDPNACYADCIISGGSDWECICECVSCGGKTPPPPPKPQPPPQPPH